MTRTPRARGRRSALAAAGVVVAALSLPLGAGPAAAEPVATIESVAPPEGDKLLATFSTRDNADGAPPLLLKETLTAQLKTDSQQVEAAVEPLGKSSERGAGERYAMLAIDNSGSMTASRISAAKLAAETFLATVPDDVRVGLVTFGDPAVLAVPPEKARDRVRAAIDRLDDSGGDTALYEAVAMAARAMPAEASSRNVVLLTDGKDEDKDPAVPIGVARKALQDSGAIFTGVAVADQEGFQQIQQLAQDLPGSTVLPASDGGQLESKVRARFKAQATALDEQVDLQVTVPDAVRGQSGTLTISVRTSEGLTLTSNARLVQRLGTALPVVVPPGQAQAPVPDQRLLSVSTPIVWVAVAFLFVALTVLLSSAFGVLGGGKHEESEVARRLAFYTFSGREPRRSAVYEHGTALGSSALTRSAVELAGRVARSRNFDRSLDAKLDAAGLPLRTGEWIVIHVGSTLGFTLLFALIGAAHIVPLLLGLIIGIAAPWLVLMFLQTRRERKFLAQLPDTLQLLAGSLKTGYSLPQAMDTVVREAQPPISGEFNRALVEARLGVPPEDALDGIANRTRSRDFGWIVLAIRIQREVGGNLAELLGTVADTLRERERLRRQVSALSAEGRLSGIILAALPLVFTVYLLLVQPEYLNPMFTTRLGLMLMVVGVLLLVVGGFWMARVVKVKV